MTPMIVMDAIWMGAVAGLAPSPHTLALLSACRRQDRGGFAFLWGGLAWDILLLGSALALSSSLSLPSLALHVLQILSGVLTIRWGLRCFRIQSPHHAPSGKLDSLLIGLSSGLATQAVNANPYVFWWGIGVPRILHSTPIEGMFFAATFLVTVYFFKLVFAWMAYRKGSTCSWLTEFSLLRNSLAGGLVAWGGIVTLKGVL